MYSYYTIDQQQQQNVLAILILHVHHIVQCRYQCVSAQTSETRNITEKNSVFDIYSISIHYEMQLFGMSSIRSTK